MDQAQEKGIEEQKLPPGMEAVEVEIKSPTGEKREFTVKEGVLRVDMHFLKQFAKSTCGTCKGAGYIRNTDTKVTSACMCALKRFDSKLPSGVKAVSKRIEVEGVINWGA